MSTPLPFRETLAALQKAGKLTTRLTAQQMAAIERALGKYTGNLSEDALGKLLDKIHESLLSVLNPQEVERDGVKVTEGFNPAQARSVITRTAEKLGVQDLNEFGHVDRMLKVAQEVANGGARHVAMNADPESVEEYPALELLRVYDRETPRGFKKGPKGELIEVPGDDWPSRWRAAASESGDEDAERVFESTGRMIALKDSDIWQALGDGAGGYDDTLGNPFPPFAFNSGYDTNEISRAECEEVGLLKKGEPVKGASLDLAGLFAPIKEAA